LQLRVQNEQQRVQNMLLKQIGEVLERDFSMN